VVGNGSALPVTSVGDAVLPGPFRLSNVLVAPHIIQNLLSVRQFTTDNSCSMEFDLFGLSVKDLATRTLLARCDSPEPLYTLRLPASPTSTSAPHVLAAATSSVTWHRRLGHPGRDVMSKLSSSTSGSGCRGSFEHLYHACQLGRHVRLPFPTSSRAAGTFDLIHCDVWTSPVISISGSKYYLLILDDFSHYMWTFPLRQKSDTFPTLSHFFACVSTQFGRTIRSIQCDNGREFYNNVSRDFFLSRGVHLRMSCPYTSPQNGRAERMIRTTNDVVRSLLLQASLPTHYWAEALATATYLLNHLPTKAIAHPTPYFALFGIHPSYDHLRVFGCACYPNLASTAPHKLAPRSTRFVFLGYSPDHKGYRCLQQEFAMKDLGALHHFLGVTVERRPQGLFLHQRQYTSTYLNALAWLTARLARPRWIRKANFHMHDYRSIVGALQYLIFTRPDIAYAVQQVCLHMHDPREPHLTAMKRILRYLRGTLNFGLLLRRSSATKLRVYTDVDWAGCPDTRRSTSGYAVFLGNSLVSWSSKHQPVVSRSSAEAEYRAVANGVAEAAWLCQLLHELHSPLATSTLVFCDNVSVVYLSTNPVQHQRTKHVEIDLHFVRKRVACGAVRVLHVPTTSQFADVFTKGLPSVVFTEFRSSLNICSG
jgi:hypothetical protein